jgi:hypothetical protein
MTRMTINALSLSLAAFTMACGSPSGTQPHAMSAAEHEAAASQEHQSDGAHANQYDPAATTSKETCEQVRARGSVCWGSETNPTAGHASEAEHHRELAEKHRAASDTLRAAESSACSGVPEADRDLSPFGHIGDIRSVSPLQEDVRNGKATSTRVAGAEVVFRAVPGLTAEWLQRGVDCHLARNSAIGHEASAAEMPFCPLTIRGAQARVRSVGDGFAVAIRSDDAEASKEILKRAEALQTSAAAH